MDSCYNVTVNQLDSCHSNRLSYYGNIVGVTIVTESVTMVTELVTMVTELVTKVTELVTMVTELVTMVT